jgi:hypothetical protein
LAVRSLGVSSALLLILVTRVEGLMLFVSDDWAADHHDIEIVAEDGRRLARRRLPEGLAGISQLHALIADCSPEEWADLPPGEAARRVKVGTGTERGPWVQALVGGRV